MAAHRQYTLRNLKTGKEYIVSEEGYKRIKDNKWVNRYTIVDERVVQGDPKSSFIPKEIREASDATKAVTEVLSEQRNKEGVRRPN